MSLRKIKRLKSKKARLSNCPDDVNTLITKARVYTEKGSFEEAIPIFEKIIRNKPNDVDMLTKLAIVQQKCGNLTESIALYKKAIKIDPEFLPARFSLAETLERYNKVDDAYAEVLAGLEIFPDDASLVIHAAACERRLHEYQNALDRLLKLDPAKLDIAARRYYYFELGRVSNKLKDYDLAFRSFTEGNLAAQKLSQHIDKKYHLRKNKTIFSLK